MWRDGVDKDNMINVKDRESGWDMIDMDEIELNYLNLKIAGEEVLIGKAEGIWVMLYLCKNIVGRIATKAVVRVVHWSFTECFFITPKPVASLVFLISANGNFFILAANVQSLEVILHSFSRNPYSIHQKVLSSLPSKYVRIHSFLIYSQLVPDPSCHHLSPEIINMNFWMVSWPILALIQFILIINRYTLYLNVSLLIYFSAHTLLVAPHHDHIKAQNAIHDLALWLNFLSPSPYSTPAILTSLSFLEYTEYASFSGPLHLLFPRPERFFLLFNTWLNLSLPIGLLQSNAASLESSFLTFPCKTA